MKSQGKWSRRQLLGMLQDALAKEKLMWKSPRHQTTYDSKVEIGPHVRDNAVKWIYTLNTIFNFNPETVMLAVTVMDNFLKIVKAHPKYIQCIALCCFIIAAKLLEEDEVTPMVEDFIISSNCGRSVSDILRMEKVILSKLQWNMNFKTSLDFLHMLHAILVDFHPNLLSSFKHITVERQMTVLVYKLFIAESGCDILFFKPSTRALALLSLELELFCPDWLGVTIMFQNFMQIDQRELIRCREVISRIIPSSSSRKPEIPRSSAVSPKKRKVEQTEVDDIYDCIKRLYGEENSFETKLSCGSQASQDEATALSLASPPAVPAV